MKLFCTSLKITTLLFVLSNFNRLPAFSQTPVKDVKDQGQAWIAYFNQTRLSKRFGLWLDVHARRLGPFDRWSTFIFRPGVTYHLNERVRFTAGYAFVAQRPNISTTRPEHRPWQQILWTSRSKKLQTQQWIRLEERYVRRFANGELQDGSDFNFRFRYLLALLVPLKGDYIQKGVPFLSFNNELHINAGKRIVYNYFDQNRLFLGIGYQFTKTLNAQLGYMNLFQQLPAGNQFQNNHVIRLFFFQNLDFRPNQE